MIRTEVLTGAALEAALDDVARLRIEVFRDWPYLYDGDFEYERGYLADYLSPTAIVVAARDGEEIVGVSTGMAMEAHADDFSAPFAGRPEKMTEIFYCAESVLLPAYRGRGLGHAFFDARETHARRLGRRYSAFCTVVRPEDHPLRPAGYRSLDPFWSHRGYEKLPGILARFSWRDIDAEDVSLHSLQFWMKSL